MYERVANDEYFVQFNELAYKMASLITRFSAEKILVSGGDLNIEILLFSKNANSDPFSVFDASV